MTVQYIKLTHTRVCMYFKNNCHTVICHTAHTRTGDAKKTRKGRYGDVRNGREMVARVPGKRVVRVSKMNGKQEKGGEKNACRINYSH